MKKMLIGLLLVASVGTMVGCTDTKVVSKKGTEIVEEAKDKVTEETKEQVVEEVKEPVVPETIEAKIGDEIVLKEAYGDGEFIFKIDNVYLTEDRNQFAEPVVYVAVIEYSVTNINIPAESFFFDLGFNNAKFYDKDGFECNTYPATLAFGVNNISPNRSGSSEIAIGIVHYEPYLEIELGNVLYKLNL